MIDAKTADWLRAYVRGGGTLLIEMPFACRDDNTWVSVRRPNHGLEDLMGCTEAQRLVVEPGQSFPAAFATGQTIEPEKWRIMLRPTTGASIVTWPDGTGAAVSNQYGKGQVIVLGINLSLAARRNWSPQVLDAFRAIVRKAGIQVPSGSPLWVARRSGPNGHVWFVVNLHDQPGTMKLPHPPKRVWVGEGAKIQGNTLTVPANEVWVAEMHAAGGHDPQ